MCVCVSNSKVLCIVLPSYSKSMNYNLIAIILIYDLQSDLKLEALSLLKSQESTSIIFPSQKKIK